jgi:CubicO group peptidase (beta-lactamase class C family)
MSNAPKEGGSSGAARVAAAMLLLALSCKSAGAPGEQADARGSSGAVLPALPSYQPPQSTSDGWPVARAETVGLSPEKLGAMERAIRAGDFPKLTSVVVARHGKLVYEGYFGDSERESLHNTRSATKTLTGMLLGIAVDRGIIGGLDAPVLGFFSDKRPVANPDPRKEKITLEDFLTMSSALECNDWDDESRGNEERMYVERDWVKFTLDLPVRPWGAEIRNSRAEVRDAGRGPKDGAAPPLSGLSKTASSEGGAPGRRFSYCTAGVATLGAAIETAAKMPLAEFAMSALFRPLGIEKASWRTSPTGLAFGGGGLELRSRDLLKLAALYLDGGIWQGKRVVSEAWVRRSVVPYVRIDEKTEYGYLWWLRSFTANGKAWPAWFMSGNGGNKVVVVPALGLVAVLSSQNYNAKGMHVVTDKLLQEHVLAAVTDG